MASIDRSSGICIRGVSSACTSELLVQAFCGFGNITDVFVKDMSGRRGRGYAFVTFEERASVAAALAGAPASIGEDAVTVEARTPPRERKVAEACENIYIKGISAGTTEEQVTDAVSAYGTIVTVQVSDDRGFAFASFETVEEATAAVNAQPLFVGGVSTTVEFRMSRAPGARRSGKRRTRKGKTREPNSIYLKGVPGDCADDTIAEALAGFGNCISVSHREDRDFAFAAFETEDGMTAAVDAGAVIVNGVEVVIEERKSGK